MFVTRCAILRYRRLSDEELLKRLKEIADAEGVSLLYAWLRIA